MQLLNFAEWFASMRCNCLPFTILLVLFPGQISIAKELNPFNEKNFYLIVNADVQQRFDYENIHEIKADCTEAAKSSTDQLLRELSDSLMLIPEQDSYEMEIEKAKALLVCKAPRNAQKVLEGILPANRTQQKIWSTLYWQASNALMDHGNSALALRRLSEGNLQNLDQELIVVGYRADGAPLKRLALDLLAEHERLSGRCASSAKVLLAGRQTGSLGAKRLVRAIQCLEELSMDKRNNLIEKALVEAQSDQAWWLVGDILRLQLMLDLAVGEDAVIIKERLGNFAKELDDRYTQLELIRIDSNGEDEKTLLENQLRSPREPTSDVEKIKN